ncbi:MAG: hypothetical protein IPL23_06025 [Saprospiraceae bacterium]|nr:hypothetical protein [Saprospiraceae bacterium]
MEINVLRTQYLRYNSLREQCLRRNGVQWEFNVLRKQCLQPVLLLQGDAMGTGQLASPAMGKQPAGAMMKFKKKLTAEN